MKSKKVRSQSNIKTSARIIGLFLLIVLTGMFLNIQDESDIGSGFAKFYLGVSIVTVIIIWVAIELKSYFKN